MPKHRFERHDRLVCGNNYNLLACKKDRDLAIRTAYGVLAMMRNHRVWRIHVFENLGWHWDLECGYLSLSGNGYSTQPSKEYQATWSDKKYGAGTPNDWFQGNGRGYFSDPNKAVDYAVRFVEEVVRRDNRSVAEQLNLLRGAKKC